ncbi:unnamed protein product [Brachionus calyciflorus]|uniref:glycerol kinase n=1 Tax=Brachionus calyciflorus TaxID=104777 RepID=A0A813RM52_9BILA|nr:unnamed protein product [Brachionus calyciflorus]
MDIEDGILAIDIGTTNLKCTLFNKNLKVLNNTSLRLEILKPFEDYFEIDPEHLLESIKNSLLDVKKFKDTVKIKCLGISTQRNSILLWNRNTGKRYTNFILWSDKRNKKLYKKMNSNLLLNTGTNLAKIATKIWYNDHLKLISNYTVDSTHIPCRLVNELEILECKLESEEFKQISCGTIDTWLAWILSKEKYFVTDLSCASSTGLYDIFQGDWNTFLVFLFGIPNRILPKIKDTCDDYGHLDKSFLNSEEEIPISAIIGDSQASLIAECCFEPGECVITIGTGTFISLVIGDKPIASFNGNYPLIGYKFKKHVIYILHCFVSNAGQSIDWAKSIGLFESYDQIDKILENTWDSGGVYYIPSLLELQGVNKATTGSGFIGLKQNTTKSQMLRAVIESIAFLIKIKFDGFRQDLLKNNIDLKNIRLSGGVTNSKIFCQLLSNLLEFPLERSNFSNTSSVYGAAFLAGLSTGLYNELDELKIIRKVEAEFKPDLEVLKKKSNFKQELLDWRKALERFVKWND